MSRPAGTARCYSPRIGNWNIDRSPLGVVPIAIQLTLVSVCILLGWLWLREKRRADARLRLRENEIQALHAAALDIYGELGLETILQKVTDRARDLVAARYGALSVMRSDRSIESFLTSGIGEEERARIGTLPQGQGLLGVPLFSGDHLRLRDLGEDPRARGFPAHHPPMHSLLAVPILCKSPFRGNLYVAEKQGAEEFSGADEAILLRLAANAALAIDTSYLHRELSASAVLQERLHIAHELHDGMVQMLAYANTKAQAAREFLRSGQQAEGMAQLEQLAAVARDVYADAREGILGLRTSVDTGQPLSASMRQFVEVWQEQTSIPVEMQLDDAIEIDPRTALQLIRVLQEALANVRKHARAGSVRVRLHGAATRVELSIEDDGRGFDPAAAASRSTGGFGLATMRERVESVGGAFTLETGPGRGTQLRIAFAAGGANAGSGVNAGSGKENT